MAYKRSIFLINQRFQLRFSFYVCSSLVALSFVYPLVVKNLFDFVIRYIEHDANGPPAEYLKHTQSEVLGLLLGFQVLLLMITFLISIFMSHRVAGPLYKLSTFFEKAKEGDFQDELFFRRSDYFQEIAQGYNEMLREVRQHLKRNADAIERAAAQVQISSQGASGEIRKELEETLRALDEARAQNQKLKL